MKKNISFLIGMVLFPAIMYAQKYEGETNKKGQPEGQGVITFNRPDGIVEILEGTFEKGMPVKGKSKRFDKDGRIRMEFEGTFQPKKKGVFTKLSDLICNGNLLFMYYENDRTYVHYGYCAEWGPYVGDKLTNQSYLGTKSNTKDEIPPEGMKFYDYLFPQYVYHLTKEETDTQYLSLVKCQGSFDVPSAFDKKIEHFTITDICGTVSDNVPDGTVYGLAYKDDDKYELYYFNGDFEKGNLKKINTLKQYVHPGKVRNLYVNSVAQNVTPFFSEEEFDEYMVIGKYHFSNKMRKISSALSVGDSKIDALDWALGDSKNRNNKDIIEKAKVICAYKLANPRLVDYNIYLVLKHYPEIANAKDVYASWDGSKKINIKDAYQDYLRIFPKNKMYMLNYVYNDWGTLTEDEIYDTEHNFILTQDPGTLNQIYKEYFPNGKYAGKDFYKEAWAEAYIDNYKRMFKKNDPKLWVDNRDAWPKYKISYFDWLHYPKLSKGIGGYSKNTRLSSLMGALKKSENLNFNKRKLSLLQSFFSTEEYVFKCYTFTDGDEFRPDVFNMLEKGSLTDEAKTYRALMDAIGAASQIDEYLCKYTSVREDHENFQRWSACHIVYDYLIEGIKSARKLAASTPEIRPACKKAEEFIKGKIDMLNKMVFIHDEGWLEVVRKYNNENQQNKEAEAKVLQEVENLGLPNYKYEDGSWQDDYGDEVYREVCFEGLTNVSCAKIWKAKNGSYYRIATGVFLSTKYRTEKDAIIGAYAYLKYGEVRQKGRIK